MGDKLFRYEMMWEKHEDFQPFLNDAWKSEGKAETMSQLKDKLHRMSGSLSTWGRTTFGSVQGEIRQLQLRLSDLREGLARQGPSEEEGAIVQRLTELYGREEVMWRQRSRIQWLAEGEKNTRFFHLRACQRKKRNKITRLVRHDGTATEDAEEMASMTRDFYEQLYTSEGVANMGEVIDVIPQKVTAEMNDQLMKPIGADEVKIALFQMFPTKAPGPDGFPAHFFQTHWELCGEEVTLAVLRVLEGRDDIRGIN
jgi:hypothetical protein